MNVTEFRASLVNLEKGDVITFVFKGRLHWATHFLAFFNVKPHAFEVSRESAIDFYTINLFMKASWISTSSYPVVCNVLRKLDKAKINIDWVVGYVFPLLKDFEIQKAQKPE